MNDTERNLNGGSATSGGDSGDSPGLVHVESGSEVGRPTARAAETGTSDKSIEQSHHDFTDVQGRYTRTSEEIGKGFSPRNRIFGEGKGGTRQVTSTTIFAAAIGSVSVVLVGVALYPLIFSTLVGNPFVYTNVPFPICAPDKDYTHDEECEKPLANFAFHDGEIVPMLVGKCYNSLFNRDRNITYTMRRALVSDQNGLRVTMEDTFTSAPKGCSEARLTIHTVPKDAPPGIYHFEGFSQVVSWRTENISWRSESFTVVD